METEDADIDEWEFPMSASDSQRVLSLRQEPEDMELMHKHLCNTGRIVVTEHDDVLEAKKKDEWIIPEEMVEVKR